MKIKSLAGAPSYRYDYVPCLGSGDRLRAMVRSPPDIFVSVAGGRKFDTRGNLVWEGTDACLPSFRFGTARIVQIIPRKSVSGLYEKTLGLAGDCV